MLSETDQGEIDSIVGGLPKQLSYPMGSEMREVVWLAYAATQKRMLIAGTAIMALGLGFTLLIKNINVKKVEQVKGMVF